MLRHGWLPLIVAGLASSVLLGTEEFSSDVYFGPAVPADRRAALILFWWRGVAGFEQPAAVETIDIAPTLASVIKLDVPASEFDGASLDALATLRTRPCSYSHGTYFHDIPGVFVGQASA